MTTAALGTMSLSLRGHGRRLRNVEHRKYCLFDAEKIFLSGISVGLSDSM